MGEYTNENLASVLEPFKRDTKKEIKAALPKLGKDYFGELVVKNDESYVHFTFFYYDLRYKPKTLKINSADLDDYIDAIQENWLFFQALKEELPKGTNFSTTGKLGMQVDIGKPRGFSVGNYRVDSIDKLNMIISDLKWANRKAKELKKSFF